MGVKNLWDILECCKKTLPLHHLQNKRVCIDLSCWMVQLQNVNKTHCAMKEKLYLRGLFHRVRALIALNCSIVFVTDGAIPAVKISTYRKRLNSVTEGASDDIDGRKTLSLRRNTGSEFSCMIREAKALGLALGIPCLDGVEEGEAQCAVLNSESICDGCFSSDSDIFLFGARTVYRDICLGEGGYVVCYEMADIEEKLGFGRHSMIVLALLLGSDYSQGVYGFGPESACQVTKSIGEDTILQYLQSEDVSFMKSLKTFKKHGHFSKGCGKENIPYHKKEATGNELHLERENEFLGVIKAYMKPKCHLVDSDPVYRVLAVHPFRRTELQQICAQFFGWPPEKTDEYILPKIAERDLRRFANLRSSSLRLGVTLPLHKMPVKCPVSEVLKHRRVQGKECFEVSWEEFDGLKTSVVPADLVESACPERISEFKEKMAQKKKQKNRKPRSKKSEDQVSMVNLDQKLQQLLLDIESQNNGGSADSSSSHTSISGSSKTIDSLKVSDSFDYEHQKNNIDQKLEKLSLDIEATDNVRSGISRSFSCTSVTGNNSIVDLTISDTFDHGCHHDNDNESICALNSHSNLPSTMGVDVNNVIDLSSPSPATSSHFVSKFQGNKGQATVIDLIDSDTEMSPEHAQKAVKLRQFLASIREDIS